MKSILSLWEKLRSGIRSKKGQGHIRFRTAEKKALGRLFLKNQEGEILTVIVDSLKRKEKEVWLPEPILRSGAILCSKEGKTLCVLPKATNILCTVTEQGEYLCEPPVSEEPEGLKQAAPQGEGSQEAGTGPDGGPQETPVQNAQAAPEDGPAEADMTQPKEAEAREELTEARPEPKVDQEEPAAVREEGRTETDMTRREETEARPELKHSPKEPAAVREEGWTETDMTRQDEAEAQPEPEENTPAQ